MQTRSIASIKTVVALALIAAAASAQSAMYRWIDQNGAMNYSDQLPQEPSKVRALTVMDAPAPASALEKRSQELIDTERSWRGDNAAAGPEPSGRDAEVRGSSGRNFGSGELHGSARLNGVRPAQPEAPRDPCLRSSDPRCFEKNRDAYVPYLGYAPSMTRATRSPDVPFGIGASSALSASGAVGGSVGSAANAITPRRAQPWRLRNSLKDAKDLSR